ncbi:hypothetical protein EcT2_00094 [Escherichia phage T2]|uniref:Uncharacterized protein n=2 Tax=Enterobacteria phage T2 TaxID=2060721 RepID=A0A6J3ZW33_BPT2|nr:hypothetical protein EcT2_00094 [Escherichia phage T2]
MHYKDYDVTVVNTLTGTQGKGSSLSFIAVYELKDGYRFSEYISPEMYSSIEKGDNYCKFTSFRRKTDIV